jgi:hypothetical protein
LGAQSLYNTSWGCHAAVANAGEQNTKDLLCSKGKPAADAFKIEPGDPEIPVLSSPCVFAHSKLCES